MGTYLDLFISETDGVEIGEGYKDKIDLWRMLVKYFVKWWQPLVQYDLRR